ncbi:MAG TPA: GAF domain-containing protein [Oscillatoriales cyanobacterium M59_W2019_021]|nr:GAF domain-containing protein [Oscillatoriales cyanobacterium M4454_W2019_049]HIK51803.1 GAF domain-containing protein [Oscillatoriales cyanobacterium M59_W2019_021]
MSASPNENVIQTIDVTPTTDRPPKSNSGPSSSGLALNKGNFSAFLAPLTQDSFKKVVTDVEEKLKVMNQTLGMLDSLLESQGFDAILDEMLRSITLKTGELLNADRTTIWLLDDEKHELFTIDARDERGNAIEIRVPIKVGIVGEAAREKKIINIPYDFYDDPRSAAAQALDKKNHYRTYTMLTMPLLNEETEELVAVVQLVNKLKFNVSPHAPLEEKIDIPGFTQEDEKVFIDFAPSIRLILESSKSFYRATQKQRAAAALMSAVNSLSKASLDLEDTLKRVMDEAKALMNADRSTLWLIDEEKDQLWTKVQLADGTPKELRIPRTAGFAGMVAQSGEPLLIPFDAYDDPRSQTARQTDKETGYRTCSLLCMPVFNADKKLIGVTQLVNKTKPGEHPPYDPKNYPHAPEQWKASFTRTDQEFMEAFNIQAGIALQNAKLFATVKQQEQRQKDILRSLTNGVISTDKSGHIIAANDSAMQLLGISTNPEGLCLRDMVHLKTGNFAEWFDAALHPKEDKDRQQYYPNQELCLSENGIAQSINLTINSMADVADPTQVNGALVVMEDISDEMQVKNLMYKYMTPEVAEALLASGDTGLGGKRKEVSVLFSDIRSYTTLTEKLKAEEVVTLLNAYFEEMVDAVFNYGGTLDKYIGDALMAVFGSPAPLEDHAWCAMQAAISMRQRLAAFNAGRQKEGKIPIQIGMGIHSDEVVSGNIGSSKRMELTSIGDGVNLASRLEGTSKQYGVDIVISEQTYHGYQDRVVVRELDFITVKGKTQPVTIYELVAIKEGDLAREITPDELKAIDLYHQGRESYLMPAKHKLSQQELIKLLEKLEGLSDEQVAHLSYNEDELLATMVQKLHLEELIELLGENTLKRLLETENLQEVTLSQLEQELPTKIGELTPRERKKLLVAKLKQFAGAKATQQMLEEEAGELSTARIKKLIDLCKPVFVKKAKAAFKQAKTQFDEVLKIQPKNKAAQLHVQRCQLFLQTPPGEDWDGVWKLTDK